MPNPKERVEELAERFLAAARDQATGTLRVTDASGRTRQILFREGNIADLDTGRDDTLLEAALVATGSISEKDLKRARKTAAKSEVPMGAALLEIATADDQQIQESIHWKLTEEISEVFQWDIASIEFFEHQADERLESFFSELTDYYEVLVDSEDVFLEAAHRIDRWDLVEKHFGMLRDVFYATPASFRYFRAQDQFPSEFAIVSKVDGAKDVDEVIKESGIDPFLAVSVIRQLKMQGELELINPVQMYQLGVELSSGGKHEKAAKLFIRAHERGLDDFDLQLKLAQALESLGKIDESTHWYMEFAEKCVDQLRVEDAIRSLKRVLKTNPEYLPAQKRYMEILLQQNRTTEVTEVAISLAEQLRAKGDARGGLETLLRIRSLDPTDLKLQQKIVEFAEACRDFQMARTERESLVKNCDQRKDVEVALETYQRMFCEGNDSMDVRLKLVELHRAKGNRQKALEHINSILNLPEKRRPIAESALVQLHEAVKELRPTDLRSNRWLVDYHLKKEDKSKATEVLTSWISNLEREGDFFEMAHVYERLILVDDRHEHRWGLAMTLEKLGKQQESRRELRSLANLSLRRKEFDQAKKAIEYVLKNSPLDIESHKMQCELHESESEEELALRACEDVALLSIISRNVQEAELYCRRLPTNRPSSPEIIRRLGRLCLDFGDRQKAVEQFLKAAKLHLQQGNQGLSKTALDELLSVEPSHSEAKALSRELVKKPTAPQETAPQMGEGPVAEAPRVADSPPPSAQESVKFLEPSAPIKTRVSGITARLRKLKFGSRDGAEPSAQTAPAAAASEGAATAGEHPPGDGGRVIASAALRSASSRLKALAGKKAREAHGEGAEGCAPVTAEEGLPPIQSTRPPAPEGEPAPQVPPAGAETGEQNPPPTATKKLKLDKSASRLAALRKQAVETAS